MLSLDHANVRIDQSLHKEIFIDFNGYKLFPLRLICSSSGSTFLGHLKITSSVFSAIRVTLLTLSQSRLTSLFRFFTDLLVRKRFVPSGK